MCRVIVGMLLLTAGAISPASSRACDSFGLGCAQQVQAIQYAAPIQFVQPIQYQAVQQIGHFQQLQQVQRVQKVQQFARPQAVQRVKIQQVRPQRIEATTRSVRGPFGGSRTVQRQVIR